MQPTTLNNIVSLFLVGGLAMIGAVALLLRHAGTIELPRGLKDLAEAGGEGFFAVISGLLLLPIASMAGAVCEGMTAPTIRRLIKWIAKRKYLVRLLCQGQVFEAHNFWKDQFRKSLGEIGALHDFPDWDSDHGLAVGILYDKGQEQAITWTESHYSTYVLASNFAFLALLAQCYLIASGIFGWMQWQNAGWASLGVVAVLYSSLGLSLDCYLFSYQFALRQATVSLLIETRVEQGPGAYTTVAAPDVNRASHGRRR